MLICFLNQYNCHNIRSFSVTAKVHQIEYACINHICEEFSIRAEINQEENIFSSLICAKSTDLQMFTTKVLMVITKLRLYNERCHVIFIVTMFNCG